MTILSRRGAIRMAVTPAVIAALRADDLAPTATRIHPDTDGKLAYVPDEQGNTILDFSHAGYGGGGVPVPTVPVRETIWPVAGDNTANVQAAIDKVSALSPDKSGFRGAVFLRAGYYKMATPVTIQASGVVLRGESMGDTGTVLIGTGNPRAGAAGGGGGRGAFGASGAPGGGRGAFGAAGASGGGRGAFGAAGASGGGRGGGAGGPGGGQPTLIHVAGASGWTALEDTKQVVTSDYVPVGSRAIPVASARAFRPGDKVIVRRIGNQDWINTMGMNGDQPANRWRPFNVEWDRVVVDVQGNTLTI